MLDRKSLYSVAQTPTKEAAEMFKKPNAASPSSSSTWIFIGSILSALVGGLVVGLLLANTQVSLCNSNTSMSDSWICQNNLVAPRQTQEVRSVNVSADETKTTFMKSLLSLPASSSGTHAADSGAVATTAVPPPVKNQSTFDMIRQNALSPDVLKPVAMELVALTIFQALGLRMIRLSKSLLGRFWPRVARVLSLPSSRKILYHITKIYKKTHASKIVTRTKKYLKHYQHIQQMDELQRKSHDHHSGEHDGDDHSCLSEEEQMQVSPLSQRKYFLE